MQPPRKPGAQPGPISLPRERIYSVIDCIPAGRVSTYGAIAKEAGLPRGARQVAAALRHLSPARNLPWYRVVNASGRISIPPGPGANLQRARLEKEGITFTSTGRIDLAQFGWPTGAF